MKMGATIDNSHLPSFLPIDGVSLSGVNVKSVSRPAGGPAAKGAGGNTGQGQVRYLPRDGILERYFQSRFLGINSSLLRLEFCLVFYPHFSVLQNATHE